MDLYVTDQSAKERGYTHKARYLGLIPGYFNEAGNGWLPKSSLFGPVEFLLTELWLLGCHFRNEEPDFMFELRSEM